MDYNRLKASIARHEGLRLTAYTCPAGKISIGFGRNLEDVGITRDMAEAMLGEDLMRCENETRDVVHAWRGLNDVRREVLVEMCYNLGKSRFSKFRKMLEALEQYDYGAASAEMIESKWASQVGARATTLARRMYSGVAE